LLRSSLLALAAVLVVLPASASAQTPAPVQIKGDVLTISTDANGRTGVAYTGSTAAEFCCSVSVDPTTGILSTGHAGFSVVVLQPDTGTLVFGRDGTVPDLVSGPTLAGAGTAASPFTITTKWSAKDNSGAPLLDMTQVLSYVNGNRTFNGHLDVANTSGQPLTFRASVGADLTGGGQDSGFGLFDPGPPRFVAGLNPTSGALTGLQEATPWSHYGEGNYTDMLSMANADPRSGTNLPDNVVSDITDNGVAAQWDNFVPGGLPPGQSTSYDVTWRFDRTFDLQPGSALALPGVPVPFTAKITNTNGTPRSGVKIVFNDGSGFGGNTLGTVTTDKNGQAVFDYVPTTSGTDFNLTAFADLNGNGTQDPNEPTRTSKIAVGGNVTQPPIQGQSATAAPLAGTVKVKFPKNFAPAGKQDAFAHSAANKFTVLKNAETIPVGSEIDVSRGSIQLASSTSGVATAATIQTGTFSACQPSKMKKSCKAPSSGTNSFTMMQSSTGNGLTEMVMTGSLSCPSGKGKAVAAKRKKKSRSIWGSDNGGKFRTRGRNASATVRGTEWFTKDTCSGTTTKVTRGSVTVKDFTKKKNVVVKQGHSYTAKPKKKNKRR
jgi:hypothetical protein